MTTNMPDVDRSMARASFSLLALGGVFGLVSTAFPSERPRDVVGVAVVSLCALALSSIPLLAASRLRPLAFELLAAAGTSLVSAGLYLGGTTAYEFFYLWVGIYAAYFFGRARAGLQIAFVFAACPIAEQLGPGAGPNAMRWLIGGATLVVSAAMVALLKQALLKTIEALEALIEASPLATMELDEDGRVMRWNARAEELFGWRREETVGRLLPLEAELEKRRLLLDYVMNCVPLTDHALTCVRKDSSEFEGSLFTAEVGRNGRRGGRVVLVADRTARVELARRLCQAGKMEAVGRLAGGIAHDFNNLLLVIRSHAWLLRQRVDDVPEVAAIEHATEDAGRIVRQLLAFSRSRALEPDAVDLDDVLAEVEELLEPVIGSDIIFTRSSGATPATVLGDPTQLELIVVNLALNARDAMPMGGTLELATEPAVRGGSRWVRLRVTDTGIGMDRETRSRVFEPFFTTKGLGHGTGLGLAIVHELVTQNGGEIEVASSPGRGTTFSVYLPHLHVPEIDEALVDEPEEADDDPLGMETVLVVDDEADVRDSLRQALQRYGYRVITAADAEDALASVKARGSEIDVVVTDVVMAGISGFELGRRVASLAPDLPVIYISGYPDEVIVEGPLPGPVFLEKPFAPPVLARTIRETVGSARMSCA